MLSYADLIFRLAAAMLIGCAIGVDREIRSKPTGVRTLGLVGLGSALVVLAGLGFADGPANAEVSRVVQGIITGIGFLGAGVILKDAAAPQVHGLTTAASIWVTACLGIACGLGAWVAVVVGFALMFLLLVIGGAVDHAIHRRWSHARPDPVGRSDRSPPS